MTNKYPKLWQNDVVVQELEDEVLVYDLNTDKAHSLNQTTAFIWRNCDGARSPKDLAELAKRHFGAEFDEELVELALDKLSAKDLVEPKLTVAKDRFNRRDLIIKYGAAAVAMPVILTLTTPTAVQAASCASGSTCNVATDCPPIPNRTATCTNNCCVYSGGAGGGVGLPPLP